MPPLRRKRRSRVRAPATVLFTEAKDAHGRTHPCVYAACQYGDGVAGPVWTHTTTAVRKVLAALRACCNCGRPTHVCRGTEGRPLPPPA